MAPSRRRPLEPGAYAEQGGAPSKDPAAGLTTDSRTRPPEESSVSSVLERIDRRLCAIEASVFGNAASHSAHVSRSNVSAKGGTGAGAGAGTTATSRTIEEENAWLRAQLEDRFRELGTLTRMLYDLESQASTQPTSSTQALTGNVRDTGSAGRNLPAWNLGRLLKRPDSEAAKLKKAIAAIEASGLFEARWYADKYITNDPERRDPIRHYLTVGAKQGNDPSASFCTNWYLDQYPDVAASGVNPLLHYIKHGSKEGRNPLPR